MSHAAWFVTSEIGVESEKYVVCSVLRVVFMFLLLRICTLMILYVISFVFFFNECLLFDETSN